MDSIFRGVWLIKIFRYDCNTIYCLVCSSRLLPYPYCHTQELESGYISLGEPLWLSELIRWGGSEVMWLSRSSHKSKYNFSLARSIWMLTLGTWSLCFEEAPGMWKDPWERNWGFWSWTLVEQPANCWHQLSVFMNEPSCWNILYTLVEPPQFTPHGVRDKCVPLNSVQIAGLWS